MSPLLRGVMILRRCFVQQGNIMGVRLGQLDAEWQRVAAQIAYLIATDGFAEDLVYLEQRHAALASAIATWHAECARPISDLISLRQTATELAARLDRWSAPSVETLMVPSKDAGAADAPGEATGPSHDASLAI